VLFVSVEIHFHAFKVGLEEGWVLACLVTLVHEPQFDLLKTGFWLPGILRQRETDRIVSDNKVQVEDSFVSVDRFKLFDQT
jgi:hypothetical protein